MRLEVSECEQWVVGAARPMARPTLARFGPGAPLAPPMCVPPPLSLSFSFSRVATSLSLSSPRWDSGERLPSIVEPKVSFPLLPLSLLPPSPGGAPVRPWWRPLSDPGGAPCPARRGVCPQRGACPGEAPSSVPPAHVAQSPARPAPARVAFKFCFKFSLIDVLRHALRRAMIHYKFRLFSALHRARRRTMSRFKFN
jgi:hypothetical protein